MRLVFYSEILVGNSQMDRAVYGLIGKRRPKIGYISSETDKERKYFQEVKDYYSKYSFSEFLYFDLDEEYSLQTKKSLTACDAIHLSGGNTYHFLYHIKRRKFVPFLKNYARNRGVLIGISAGAIIMTPIIAITTLFKDEPEDENKLGIKDFSALNLVNFEFFPHLGTAGKEKRVREYSKKTHRFIYACEDGMGIITDGKKATFWPSGGPKCFWQGELVDFSKLSHF